MAAVTHVQNQHQPFIHFRPIEAKGQNKHLHMMAKQMPMLALCGVQLRWTLFTPSINHNGDEYLCYHLFHIVYF